MACEPHQAELRETALGAAASPSLEIHLVACPACREELEEERALLRAIGQGLETGLAIEPSPGFASRVRRAAERDRPRSWQPVAAWAALAVGVGLLVVGLPPREPPLPTAPLPTGGREVPGRETGAPMARPAVPQRMEVAPARPRSAGAEPEVVVSEAEAMALLHFRTALRRGLISPRPAQVEGEPASEEPAELQIQPLEVAPLPAPDSAPEDSEPRREGRRSS